MNLSLSKHKIQIYNFFLNYIRYLAINYQYKLLYFVKSIFLSLPVKIITRLINSNKQYPKFTISENESKQKTQNGNDRRISRCIYRRYS